MKTRVAMSPWSALLAALAASLSTPTSVSAGHSGASPFDPARKSDHVFVKDEQSPGLDSGCTFRSGGPLEFDVDVTRFVGETNADGTLKDVGALVAEGVLSANATLSLPAFDVDLVAPPDVQPERDRISFNGEPLGELSGSDGQWKLNSFTVPIEKVHFPSARGVNGADPAAAANTVRVDIDTANSDEVFCTSIDWAVLNFKALSPVVLIHGNNSNGGFFERQEFTTELAARHIPFDNSITMPTQPVYQHAALLKTSIPPIVKSFGTDSVHLVVHSKGGPDTRAFLAAHARSLADEFQVLSLSTLSTPHTGSPGADVLMAIFLGHSIQGLSPVQQGLSGLMGIDSGTPDLTTWAMTSFNQTNVPALPPEIDYRAVGADVDRNGSGTIDLDQEFHTSIFESETIRRIYQNNVALATLVMNEDYQLLRSVESVTISAGGQAVANPAVNPNDTLVPIRNASTPPFALVRTFTGAEGRDHAAIANRGVASVIVPFLRATEQAKGDFR
jgi:triacylglycerol esterase/lipase EstA (alpha/beta hydrolase family)